MTAATWTCPTCATATVSQFRPTCGERPLVARHLETHGLTLEAYAPAFDNALALHARSLMILIFCTAG
jgi:hypothetical protein